MGNNSRIWLVGGTSESAILAKALVQSQLPCTVTVTTEAAKVLYPVSPLLRIWVGCLDTQQLSQFLPEEKIVVILDASHPYAVEISRLAIQVATETQIPYLRYDRPKCQLLGSQNSQAPLAPQHEMRQSAVRHNVGREAFTHHDLAKLSQNQRKINQLKSNNFDKLSPTVLDSFESLVAGDYLRGERVILTSGYKTLHLFRSWQNLSTLFARILPSPESVQAALNAGFTPNKLIAIRPPISASLEKALWQQWDISLVVTKASGVAGGEDIKRSLAAELGIKLVIIQRPDLDYPHKTSDLFQAIEFCQQIISNPVAYLPNN